MLDVTIEDGKYTIRQDEAGKVEILRFREPWPGAENIKHSKLVLCLAYAVQDARLEKIAELEALRESLGGYGKNPIVESGSEAIAARIERRIQELKQ